MAESNFKHIVRVANTDLDGNKQIFQALTKIRGIGIMLANAICNVASVDKFQKTGFLEESNVKKLDEVVRNPLHFNIPVWMVNRRKNPEDGKDLHLITTDIKFVQDNDKKKMAMTKSYKGIRHQAGLPVRGQKTKSNFRRNKGKVQGVKRKAAAKKGK